MALVLCSDDCGSGCVSRKIFFAAVFLFSKNIGHDVCCSDIMDWGFGIEGLAKTFVEDTQRYDYVRLLIGIEEGFEMLGATLFIIGFSKHLKNLQEKSTPKL